MANRNERRREIWFERGADAVTRVWPGLPRVYRCPLCGRGFTRVDLDNGLLTLEHAPPRVLTVLKGREVALTCKPCNNSFGTKLDAQSAALQQSVDFAQGTLENAAAARVTIGEHTLNVALRAEGDNVHAVVVEKQNDPRAVRAWIEAMQHMATGDNWRGQKFKVGLGRYHPGLALAGYVRAAYLVLFARFGYRYAFCPALAPVRRHLADPLAHPLKGFSFVDRDSDPTLKRILSVREAEGSDAFIVQMGLRYIRLPATTVDPDFFHRRASVRDGEFTETMTGSVIDWPTAPMHSADFW